MIGITDIPTPTNEPILSYAPGTPERAQIREALEDLEAERRQLASVVGGRSIYTADTASFRPPHRHRDVVATVHRVGAQEVQQAIDQALAARPAWAAASFEERAAVFLRAADLLAGRYRALCNAATMLGQSKTVHQAEIDAACELIDFWRFNVHFARRILAEQPLSIPGVRNRLDYRPLDGFVLAVSPFNFTSIAGNLPTAPALMGNTVVWKPASTQVLSAQVIMEILQAAGLPPGVINLVFASGSAIDSAALRHADLAGIHFTGSTGVFQHMWRAVGENLLRYRSYPRLVGETGGKDFIFAHASSDVDALCTAIVRGAFEYQGQKCSAVSRVYLPDSLWPLLSEKLAAEVANIKIGDVADFSHFMGAVIDRPAFERISGVIARARTESGLKVWLGGNCDASEGFFIEPTVVLAENPKASLMCEEVFGPVVTIYRYRDAQLDDALALCDETSPYALTGAIFGQDPKFIARATARLRFAAGNFYINDKPTGAVVGQQPFGGSRASGTNDKAGSIYNLVRWTSPRTIKETLEPPRTWPYPFMQ